MPKKKKAGGKKAGGKKGKKGKKGKSSDGKKKKADKIVETAKASVKLWEAKLAVAEQSRQQFRENAKLMMLQNDSLQSQMVQTEKDTIDVISYLKTKDQEKEKQVEVLQQETKDMRKDHRKQKEVLVENFSKTINELEDKVASRVAEVDMLTGELKLVKEFRRKRGQMQKDLDDIKEAMYNANREHKTTLGQMEQKFFEEKMRLQQEANQKIAELAEKAHSEAIANLDETTRSVYKENVRLSESLNYHMREGDVLKKRNEQLETGYQKLKNEREEAEGVMRAKMGQARENKRLIKQLQDKVATLEKSLTHIVTEFDEDKMQLVLANTVETDAAKVELGKLQRVIEMKNKEGNRIKRLAKNILDQRTEIERFFLEALEYVRTQISVNQKQYRQDAKIAYNKKMLDATDGKGDFPKIRTFNKSLCSTNNVFKDLEVAEKLQASQLRVDISDLTWEQKETVLRYLFGRMNGGQSSTIGDKLPPLPSHHSLVPSDSADQTFLTNQSVDESLNRHKLIPDIPAITEVESV